MEQQSIAKIVQQITETLSDAVSQLVVLVIALQEQNAEMPPTLPAASAAVAQSAGTLVHVARTLAEEEYGDYPEIKAQILDAATEVEAAAGNLTKSVSFMKTASNRKAGWDQLVEACKVIAGKTILLLQIVYGAELQRLFAAADLAKNALNQVDTAQVHSDPQNFANAVGEAATRANQLAEYLRSKANDVDSPLLKQELLRLADELTKDAENLINDANDLLQNPNDKKAQAKFEETLAKTKDDIARALAPLEEDKSSAEETLAGLQGKEQGGDLFARTKPAPRQKAPQQALVDEEVFSAVNREEGLTDKLEALANAADAKGVNDTLKDIQTAQAQLKANVNAAAAETDDPIQKRRLIEAVNELDRLLPRQRDVATRAAATPNKDDPSKRDLHEANREIKEALDEIADLLQPGVAAGDAARDAGRVLEDVRDAAGRGDAAALERALKDLEETNRRLAQQAKERAAANNAEDKRDLLQALQDMEKLLPTEVQLARKASSNPRDKKAQRDLDEASDRLESLLHRIEAIVDPNPEAEILSAANDSENAGDKLRNAAKLGDKPLLAQAANDLQKGSAKLAKQARAKAQKTDDTLKKKDLLDAVDELEKLLPEQLRAAQDAANNPKDKRKQDKLDDISDELLAAIAQVEGQVRSEAPVVAAGDRGKKKVDKLNEAARSGNPDAIDAALDALDEANNDLLSRGRAAEREKDDPQRRAELQNALDELEQLLPDQVRVAKAVKANPRDAKAQKELADVNDRVKAAIDDVNRAARPDHKDNARAAALEAAEELDLLLAAVEDKDPFAAAEAGRAATQAHKKLADEARAAAHNTEDPLRRRDILQAIDDLEKLLPVAVHTAREAAKQPQDKNRQKALHDVNEGLRDAADNLLASLADTPEDSLAASANQQQREADDLLRAARSGDARGVENAAKSLAKKNPKLAKQARAKAAQIDDPDKRKDILEALDSLEALLPKQIKAARDVTRTPNDKQKADDLEDVNADLIAALDRLSNAMAPKDSAQAILDAAIKEDKAARKVKDAAAKGDLAELERGLRDLEDAIRKLKQNAEAELAATDDPLNKKALEDAIRELEDLLRRLRGRAENAAKNPRDKRSQDNLGDDLAALDAISKRIVDAVNAAPVAEARKQDRELDNLQEAAKNEDSKGVAEAAKALAKRTPKLAGQARAQAKKTDDPVLRKAILDAVDELERLLPSQVAASLAVAQRPSDKNAKDNLDDASADFRDALNEVNALIRPRPKDKVAQSALLADEGLGKVQDRARHGDLSGLEAALRELENANDKLLQQAKGEAAKEIDPRRRKDLQDAIDELERLLPKVKEAARRQGGSPNDKRAQDDLEDLAGRFRGDLAALERLVDPSRQKKQNKKHAKAADELDHLLAAVVAAEEKLKRNPNDKNAQKELQELAEALERPLKELADIYSVPDDEAQIHALSKEEKQCLNDLEEAAKKGDSKGFADAAKKAVGAQKELLPKAREHAEHEDDPLKKRLLLDALDDLERLLPVNVRAAQKVVANPRDVDAQRDLDDSNDQIRQALARVDNIVNPRLEEDLLARGDKVKAKGEELKAKAKAGDKKGATDVLDDLVDNGDRMLNRAKQSAAGEEDPRARKDLLDAIARLEDMLRKLRPDAERAAGNPRDNKAQNDLVDDVRKLTEMTDDIIARTKAAPLSEAEKEEASLDRLVAGARRGDPKEVAEATKAIAGHNQKLAEQAKATAARTDDPVRKRALLDAVGELEALLPRQIHSAKEILTNPNDPTKRKNAEKIAQEYKDPLARVEAAMRPSKEKEIGALAKKLDRDLGELKQRAAAGDQPGAEDLLAKVIESLNKVKAKVAEEAATRTDDPARREALLKAIADLERRLNDLKVNAREAVRAPSDKQKQARLEDTVHETKKPIQELLEATVNQPPAPANPVAKANIILAKMKASKTGKTDPSTLLSAAGSLADALAGLSKDAKLAAVKGAESTGKGKEALELNAMLEQLERVSTGKTPRKVDGASLDSLLNDLSSLAISAAPSKGDSLEASITKVADAINKRSAALAADPSAGLHTSNIGAELSRLAVACQKGERQQFLISARTIAGHVNALNNEIKSLSNKCQDPELKERLIKNAQALQNFSVQLKILASVKAASSGPSGDSDKGLTILTQNLGVMLNATISTVGVYRIKYPNM